MATKSRSRLGSRFGIALAIVALGLVTLFFVLPEIVRRRAISDAAARGIQLTVAKARLSLLGVRLFGLEARHEKIPGAVAKAEEANVDLAGFSAAAIHLHGLDVTVPDLLVAANELESARGAGPAGGDLRRVTFANALVHLARFAGASTSLEVEGVSGELLSTPALGDEAHLGAEKITGSLGASPFGPWRTTFDRTRDTMTLRVMLDPSKPQVPQVILARGAGKENLDVKIPRTHLKSLGLPFSAFGLTAEDDPEIEVDASALTTSPAPGTSGASAPSAAPGTAAPETEGALVFQSWGVHVGRFSSALDVKIGGKWKGQGDRASIQDGIVAVGPFGGTLGGTVRGIPPRLDFTFESTPIPCTELGSGTAASQPNLAGPLGLLGSVLGNKALTGTATLTGALVFDLANPAENRLTLKPSADCSFTLR
ncbi:hypothetical protein [Pendulispora albinea]|uniref:AsmA domain-containing protein n=1 Tax=Pendulispora albinea TaxID=2741071 RepID=A0ABZ2M5S5_9BACT